MADLIKEHKTELANLEVLDNGKPFGEADFDIQCVVDTFRYYAGWCDKIHGNTIPAGIYLRLLLFNKKLNSISLYFIRKNRTQISIA